MRSRKVEAAIKKAEMPTAIGDDYTDQPIESFTNSGSDCFCPFIDNNKLAKAILSKRGNGTIHRVYPVDIPFRENPLTMNQKNKHYHSAQLENYECVQYCKFDRNPISTANDLCEKYFRKCETYREHIKQ